MAFVAVNGLFLPDHEAGMSWISGTALGTDLLDAAGEMFAFVFRAPKAGDLSIVGFLTATVTTGDVLKVSFQTVDTTDGDPDETVDQFRVITIADGDDNVWKTTGIISSNGTDGGTKRTVTAGELVAVVFEFDSRVSGDLSLNWARATTDSTYLSMQCYLTHKTGGTWSKEKRGLAMIAIQYSDGSFAYIGGTRPVLFAASNWPGRELINTGSTPDEIALFFQVPFACKINGCWIAMASTARPFDIVLYDSDGTTALETVSVDDVIADSGESLGYFRFTAEHTLTKDTNYRLAYKPTSGSSISTYVYSVDAAAIFDQMSGGQKFHYSSRVDAGSWTETATKRPAMGIAISALDDGVGGGGASGARNPMGGSIG